MCKRISFYWLASVVDYAIAALAVLIWDSVLRAIWRAGWIEQIIGRIKARDS
jgi:hypothetical protein